MPVLENFSDYLARTGFKERTVEAYYDAAVALVREQEAGTDPRQRFFAEMAPELVQGMSLLSRRIYGSYAAKNGVLTPPQDTNDVKRQFGEHILGFYNRAIQAAREASSVRISDYAAGKRRRTAFGEITITVDPRAWADLGGRGGNLEQILGILAQEPLDLRNAGSFKGVRCIKPEPYGWIFSTSSAVRLVDDSTSLLKWPPAALNFNKVKMGH